MNSTEIATLALQALQLGNQLLSLIPRDDIPESLRQQIREAHQRAQHITEVESSIPEVD